MRYGYALRIWRENNRSLGQSSGRIDFDTAWTRGPLDNSPVAPLGQGLASFLLGEFLRPDCSTRTTPSRCRTSGMAFFQDDGVYRAN